MFTVEHQAPGQLSGNQEQELLFAKGQMVSGSPSGNPEVPLFASPLSLVKQEGRSCYGVKVLQKKRIKTG